MNSEFKRVSANTAAQQTKEAIFKKHKSVIDEAFDKMHQAINEGKTSVTFEGPLAKALCNTAFYFRSLGFEVTLHTYPTREYAEEIVISWAHIRF